MENKKLMEEREYIEKELSALMEFTMRLENEVYSMGDKDYSTQ